MNCYPIMMSDLFIVLIILCLAVRLMHEHLLHVEESLTFDRKVPTHDISLALA